MGISIDLHNYEIKKLWQDFIKLTKVKNTAKNYDKFLYVLKLHGVIIFDRFVILNNEAYEDYNRYYQITQSLIFAFDLVDKQLLYDNEGDPINNDYHESVEVMEIDYKVNNIFDTWKNDNHKNYYSTDNAEIKSGDNYDVLIKIQEYKKEKENER